MRGYRLEPVDVKNVRFGKGFFLPRLEINRRVSLAAQFRLLEETGRIDNFRVAAGRKKGRFQGVFFNDSDVYKWIEAASYSLMTHPDRKLEKLLDRLIDVIAAAQDKDGYLNTYFIINEKKRWADLEYRHELYCAGHLLEAADAHYRATGKKYLLAVAVRLANHVHSVFTGRRRHGVCGHPEIELGLIRLFRATGRKKYLDLARHFVDERGSKASDFAGETDENGVPKKVNRDDKYYPPFIGAHELKDKRYYQTHAPVRRFTDITGHAVRALYLNAAVTDLYAETGDRSYKRALDRMWRNLVDRRTYVTGALGARIEGEAFGLDYELPNEHNYGETCAQIAGAFWNHRMAQLTGEAKYEDALELALFNSILSGVSLDGRSYAYPNRLKSSGQYERQAWFRCACCPPNLARFLASLGTYLYSTGPDSIYVHQYVAGKVKFSVAGGREIVLIQNTDYPWKGEIGFSLRLEEEETFTLCLRVPGWADKWSVDLNGGKFAAGKPVRGYLRLRRRWRNGDRVRIRFPMETKLISAHPRLLENRKHVAIKRGPVVYCLEQFDHPAVNLFDVRIDPAGLTFREKFEKNRLGGVVTISFPARVETGNDRVPLYSVFRPRAEGKYRRITARAIPYFAWNNRGKNRMIVWIPFK